ncbi:NUDIX hydrolase [Oceanobacter mangrovi]|uniref:NUDIX hydrolase n=1 Tax=Oceanobacter mangrovi TaxID=2862510 RepID=UPI001C8D9275|nr:NUDIX domain-containing protein [Oceanobacter mangrovi]
MTEETERQYLNQYNIKDYESPLYSVDIAIFTLHNGQLKVLLVERAAHPFKHSRALPGGFVDLHIDADIEATARRKLVAKTGVDAPLLEQVTTVGNASRDPRGWSVTTLYMALIPYAPTADFVDTVSEAIWCPMEELKELSLAFDHQLLIELARERLKNKTAYSVLPLHVLERPFTLSQLQHAFELLMGKSLEKKSFRRRILNAELLHQVGEGVPEGGKGRPAGLYEPSAGSERHLFVRVFGD